MTNTDLLLIYKRFEEIDRQLKELRKDLGSIGVGLPKKQWLPQWEENLKPTKPAQWPNESYTDYLKRIGEYNEASIVPELKIKDWYNWKELDDGK